jgi:hypothetical protein
VARRGIRIKIKVLAYFWPDEDDATNAAFMKKINPVEQAEVKHRAKEAGLHLAGGMPTGGVTPDGMKVR